MLATSAQVLESDDEARLVALGLSTTRVHDAFRGGLSRARNRSRLAAPNAPGSDVYHDGWEALGQLLTPLGWSPVLVQQQPRLVHPEGELSLTIASAHGIAERRPGRQPRTNPKGSATRAPTPKSAQVALPLPEFDDMAVAVPTVHVAPSRLWMVLYELTTVGLALAVAEPAEFDPVGAVIGWGSYIPVAALLFDDDLSVFRRPEEDPGSLDVPVTRR